MQLAKLTGTITAVAAMALIAAPALTASEQSDTARQFYQAIGAKEPGHLDKVPADDWRDIKLNLRRDGFRIAFSAGGNLVLHGLFCNSTAKIKQTLALASHLPTLGLAVEVNNIPAVTCVHATHISYVVRHPVIIETVTYRGGATNIYRAKLVKVLVGNNPRPVEPPLEIYFVPMPAIPGTDVEHEA